MYPKPHIYLTKANDIVQTFLKKRRYVVTSMMIFEIPIPIGSMIARDACGSFTAKFSYK